jgi:hypothetical protein
MLWRKKAVPEIAAVFLPLLFLAFIRFAGFTSENSVDCYYHIFMADSGPSVYMKKEFPAVSMSVWTKHFSDKELGFHLILSGVRSIKESLKLSLSPPFNIEALVFAGFMILSFSYLLWFFKVKDSLYYSLLLIIISPFFTNRILMLRPHTLSITLMLLSLPILFSIDSRRKLWRAFLLGIVTSWCYSNPHFILLPGVAVMAALYLKKGNSYFPFILPLTLFAGLISGYIFHPQFPNTFINWKIQSIDVIIQALFHLRAITIGGEFHSPSYFWIFKNSLPFMLLIFNFLLLCRLYEKKDHWRGVVKKLSAPTIAVGIISVVTLCMVFAGVRAMEYAAPFSIIFTALVINEFYKRNYAFPQMLSTPEIAKYTRILILLLGISVTLFQIDKYQKIEGFRPLNDFRKWTETADIPKNAIIANLIWSDFSFLIYSTPQYRYLSGQEPMFSYALYPENMRQMELFRREKIKLTPSELAKITNANFAFIRKPYKRFALSMIKQGFHPAYSGKDGWLFSISSSPLKKLKEEKTEKQLKIQTINH